MRRIISSLILLCVSPLIIAAQDDELKIPSEVAPFIETGTKAISLARADLNGDSREDFILVLEKANPAKDENDLPVGSRPLLILVRGAGGKLTASHRPLPLRPPRKSLQPFSRELRRERSA